MGLPDRLRQARDSLRRLRLSLGPESYFQYKRRRKDERKQADDVSRRAKDVAGRGRDEAEHGRETAAREREFEKRYAREQGRDVAPEQADEGEPGP